MSCGISDSSFSTDSADGLALGALFEFDFGSASELGGKFSWKLKSSNERSKSSKIPNQNIPSILSAVSSSSYDFISNYLVNLCG